VLIWISDDCTENKLSLFKCLLEVLRKAIRLNQRLQTCIRLPWVIKSPIVLTYARGSTTGRGTWQPSISDSQHIYDHLGHSENWYKNIQNGHVFPRSRTVAPLQGQDSSSKNSWSFGMHLCYIPILLQTLNPCTETSRNCKLIIMQFYDPHC
jgi:hypothetical protein